jgi:hypothetical protein
MKIMYGVELHIMCKEDHLFPAQQYPVIQQFLRQQTIPPGQTTVPPLVDPIEIYNMPSTNNISEHLLLSENDKLIALPARWLPLENRIVIERLAGFTLYPMYMPGSQAIWNVRQFDQDLNEIQVDYNQKFQSNIIVNALTKRMFINLKRLQYCNTVPGSTNICS